MDQDSEIIEEEKKWRKVLYEDQNVPDNYVDVTFMNELKKNLYTRTYDYWTVVRESGVVTQQACSICIFVSVFIFIENMLISPQSLFLITMVTSILGYFTNNFGFSSNELSSRTVLKDLKTMCIFIGFGFCLSTVLMTLSQTISTDTIYTMTILMFLMNLLFFDYGSRAAMVSQPVSLNSAIFASVCLASRLPTEWDSFAVITFAFEMFALWPILRANMKSQLSTGFFVGLTAVLSLISLVFLASISFLAAISFVLIHAFISFICPALLVNMQTYKNNIHGPWEEAVIKR